MRKPTNPAAKATRKTEADPKLDPRWRRRPDARPAEILEAALTVFSAKGFAATRLDDVALAAGISKGTLYLYFPGKTELFQAMVTQMLPGALAPALDAAARGIAAGQIDAGTALRLFVERAKSLLADPRRSAIPRLILGESANFPELAKFYYRQVIAPMRERLAALIEAGIASGAFRPVDARETARLVVAPVLLAALWHQTFAVYERHKSDPDLLLSTHLDILLAGLAPQARAS